MKRDEAYKIYETWVNHIEILDKMSNVFSVIPESFLPYKISTLEKALNLVAEDYFNKGDKKKSDDIMATLIGYLGGLYFTPNHTKMSDVEALFKMKKDLNLFFENETIGKMKLERLLACSESWLRLK